MSEAMHTIVRRYYQAFTPPMAVTDTTSACAALDLIIDGTQLPVGDAVILARRVKRFIQDQSWKAE